MTILLFVGGGALLVVGAELLVRGASSLAEAAGVPPLVVGLTVVAFGTSSPELAVTVGASLGGQGDVALGNVVGSNIFNVLFILGLSAAIAPLVVSHQLIRLDVPLMVVASVAVLLMALDGVIGGLEGGVLFAGILLYTTFQIVHSLREAGRRRARRKEAASPDNVDPGAARTMAGATAEPPPPQDPVQARWIRNLAFVVGGLILLVFGARWLVDAAVETATALGVSELVIGLTIVAAGTSLPEVATSVLASVRGQRDIAVGNVIGSNIFNILAVLGLGSLLAPRGLLVAPGVITFDIPVMIGVAVACLPIFFTGWTIARWEGFVFLGFYAAYASFLVLDAVEHPTLDEFRSAMLLFVLPLTALTLVVLALRGGAARRD